VDRPVGTEERQVAELVLAVLGPDHDDPPARGIGHRAPGQVGHVRVQVAPLRGQQIDDVDVLGGGLKEGRRRGEEMHVRIGGDPSPAMQVDRPVQGELDVAGRGVHVEPRPRRGPVEPADDLDIHPARRQLDGEPAGHVCIRRRPEDEVAAGVLEERRVDLVAMADRRQVAPVGRGEADPARDRLAGGPVHDLDLDRDARRRQHLDRARPGGIAPRAAGSSSVAGTSQSSRLMMASWPIDRSTTLGPAASPCRRAAAGPNRRSRHRWWRRPPRSRASSG
jgi:hypothetical protein